MPRDGSGAYTLPSGNPVVDGTIIDTGWANPTMADFAVQFNNVLTRDGILGPNLPFKFVSGTVTDPGATFAADPTTGFFRANPGEMNVAVSGAQVGYWDADGYHGDLNIDVFAAAAADTAAAPGFTWVGDLDTGMFGAAADVIGWSTGGTERARLNSTGLGIGVDPTSSLHVKNNAPGAMFQLENNTFASSFQVNVNDTYINAGGTGFLSFRLGAAFTERMVISATGKVGIGVTPSGADLEMAGGMRANGNTVATAGEGLELLYSAGAAYINAYNRSLSQYRALVFGSSSITSLGGGATTVLDSNSFRLETPGYPWLVGGVHAAAGYINYSKPAVSVGTTPTTVEGWGTTGTGGIAYNGQWRWKHSEGHGANVNKEGFKLNLYVYDTNSGESGVLATFDGNGNFAMGSGTIGFQSSGRSCIEAVGANESLFGMRNVATGLLGYMYHTGANMSIFNVLAGSLIFGTNGLGRMSITAGGIIQDAGNNELGYKDVPMNSYTGASVLAIGDRGRAHYKTDATQVTVPGSVFTAGNIVTIFNWSTSNMTIVQGGGCTMYKGGSGLSGNRTLLGVGAATILWQSSTACVITGNIT